MPLTIGTVINKGYYPPLLQIPYTIPTPGKYWVVITVNGVSSSASEPVTITMDFSSLKPIITASSFSLCAGGSVELTIENYQDFSSPEVVYLWYKDGAEIANTNNRYYLASEIGSYAVAVKSVDEVLLTSDEEEVVESVAQPTIATLNPSPCPNSTVTLTIENIGEYPSETTFQWFENGIGVMEGSGPLFVATQQGVYSVIAKSNSCQSLASNPVNVTLPNCP